MKKFNVYVTLHQEYVADSESEAAELAMNDLENRDGMEIVKHEVLAVLDDRYTIAPEHCGRLERVWVVRFCGTWVGQDRQRWKAERIALAHNDAR